MTPHVLVPGTEDLAKFVIRAARAAKLAAAESAPMRMLYREAYPLLAKKLPTTFQIGDVRAILVAEGLIANDGTEELRGFGTWAKKLGARKLGYVVGSHASARGAPRVLWEWPLTARGTPDAE